MKTEETIALERAIYVNTVKMGVFGCFEVTIGWFGKERVDYMTYDTKGVFRCYEIKVSKADFRSSARHTFVGHYNYFVMPHSLYLEIKDEIPAHIGVYCDHCDSCIKKAKRQALTESIEILKDSMIRSLARDAEKVMKSRDKTLIERYRGEVKNLRCERDDCNRRRIALENAVYNRFGREVLRELKREES